MNGENMSAGIQKEDFDLWEYASAHTSLKAVYDPDFGKLLDQYSQEAEDIALIHLQP